MTAKMPNRPKIYHITHLRNLPNIAQAGCLWSDAKRIELRLQSELVGMSQIKRRRLQEIEVACHASTHVGDYVPFYFCPRSVMLFILHRGNHPDLVYAGGQRPIVHLQADLLSVVKWAEQQRQKWAFSDRNAGTFYCRFYDSLAQLKRVINWMAIGATDFRDVAIKEGKQAEFLVHQSFPWSLIEQIGVMDKRVAERVQQDLKDATHLPPVEVKRDWYY